MVVKTNWPGATAREVEQQVTDRIERKLQEVAATSTACAATRKPGESLVFFALKDSAPPATVPETWYQVRKKIGDIRNHAAAPASRARSSTTSSATPSATSTR